MVAAVVAGAGVALLFLVTLLGAVDTRDGRDWQARSEWTARHEGD